jgi:succinate dehydrogenase flavin-adding protein (antitoxin of CptAB toxin-antitoxin module)
MISHSSGLYNYADDNTLSYADTDINKLIKMLEEESKILIYWYSINKMKANPEKVQAITVGKKNT